MEEELEINGLDVDGKAKKLGGPDATAALDANVGIVQTGSYRDGASSVLVGIRGLGNQSNLAPANLVPVLSRDPEVRGSFTRTVVEGKFLSVNGQPFFVRGVTYGAFRPDERGREYADDQLIKRDFAEMAALGINTVRIPHTVPPRPLLDIAERHGLRVMVGLSAERRW